MKEIYKNTLQKLVESKRFNYIDRDRGQLENYGDRPEVRFPCALIKLNVPKRDNINPTIQQCGCTIQLRIAMKRIYDQNNLQAPQRLESALNYYDSVDAVERIFQGLKLGDTTKWECVSTIDEDRQDFDVVKITFKTTYVKEF